MALTTEEIERYKRHLVLREVGGQIHQHRRAEPTRADHEHLRGLELLLALAADLTQHQVALVALDLFRRQGHQVARSVAVPHVAEL